MSAEFVKDLENKVVLVTGSSSGIGEAIALLFARIGSKLVVTGRNEERVMRVAQKCETLSPFKNKPLTFVGDLSIDENVKQLVNKTIENFGEIHCLVTSAGFGGEELFRKTTDENVVDSYNKMIRVDVRSVLLLCQLSLPHLIKCKGCIVNISSISSIRDVGNHHIHAMSKAAIDMFTKVIALEFASKGVRVNTVNPGPVLTPAWYNCGIPEDQIPAVIEKCTNQIPLTRLGKPEDIAKAVVFLASNASTFVTGTSLVVDGGVLLN